MSEPNQVLCDVVQRAFTGASNYENVRSGYPDEAVEFFLNNLGVKESNTKDRPFTILELGCGTGKFTRVMLKVLEGKNVKVIASEPHQDMCEQFKEVIPDTEIIQCTAEKIPLPNSSVDAVIAAQSFHWFHNRDALNEIYRVLTANGFFGLTWLLEDITVPWLEDLYEFMEPIYEHYSQNFPYKENWKTKFIQLSHQLFNVPEENLSFRYMLPSSVDQAYKYYSSFSVLAGGSEQNKKAFKDYFDKVVEKHFKASGISLGHIPIKVYLCWCTKTTSNREGQLTQTT